MAHSGRYFLTGTLWPLLPCTLGVNGWYIIARKVTTDYGTPVDRVGTFGFPFMYTGELMDANELVYLRARYYHPGLGVFTGLDPVEGVNRYQYVGGNVINIVDPSGKKGEKCGGIIGNGDFEIIRMEKVLNPELYLGGTNDVLDGLHPSDANQGWLNNCSFVGSLAAFASTSKGRQKIKNAIQDNHDGTYDVTLYFEKKVIGLNSFLGHHFGWNKKTYKGIVPEIPVIVDSDTCAEMTKQFHVQIDDVSGGYNEVWALVLENAWALAVGDGNKAKGYMLMETENADERDIMQALTGSEYKRKNPSNIDFEDLKRWHVDEERPVIFGTFEDKDREVKGKVVDGQYSPYQLETSHTYYLYDVDEANQMVIVRNPWGWDNAQIAMPIGDVQKYFEDVRVAFGGFK